MKLKYLSIPILILASSPILAETIFDPEPEPNPIPPLIEVGCRTAEPMKANLTSQNQLKFKKKVIEYQGWLINKLTLKLSGNTQI